MKRVTIVQISREAGVSTATVSRVFNGREPEKVGAVVRRRVEEIIKKYNYRPNINALGLVSGRTHLIGVQTSSIRSPIMNSAIMEALTLEASQHGYGVLIGVSNWELGLERQSISAMLAQGVDGILWMPVGKPQPGLVTKLGKANCPFIWLNKHGNEEIPCVCSDEEAVGRLAAEYLLEQKRKEYFFLGTASDQHVQLRFEAWKRKLSEAGKTVRGICNVSSFPSFREKPENILRRIVPDTGIFCCNYQMAVLLRRLLRGKGISDGKVGIIAFGDMELKDFSDEPLPMIAPDSDAVGRQAFSTLLERIKNKRSSDSRKILPKLILP